MDLSAVRVLLTGHSLGGSIACLAAFDIQQAFGFQRLECYTLGAPRVGNSAFAKSYNEVIPATWHMINDQDVVVRQGRFRFRFISLYITLYKRAGLRVVLSRRHQLIVRPSLMEIKLQGIFTVFGSTKQHLLTEYMAALVYACQSQFTRRSVSGGERGVQALLQDPELRRLLLQAGLVLPHDEPTPNTSEEDVEAQTIRHAR